MKILFVGLLASWVVLGESADFYSSRYDGVDIDEVLNNQRLYTNYLKCVLGEGKCSPDGKVLKENIPEALQTGCAKCSPAQKARANKIIRHMMKNNDEDFEKIKKMYDPEGKFKELYKDGFKE